MSNPHEQGGISVTIKGDEPGGKFNDAKSPGTWVVFHGTPEKVREQIIEVFELGEEAKSRPLFDLVNEATRLFKATANASQGLGASVLSSGSDNNSQSASGAGNASGGDVWAQAAAAKAGQPAEEKPTVDLVLDAIAGTTTVAELQTVWAENQSAFDTNPSYMEAYRAKGRALSAA